MRRRAPRRASTTCCGPDAMSVNLKSADDIEKMRVAGRLAADVLDYITPFVQAGTTTGELNRLCHDYMVETQGTIPGDKKLKPGDIVNIDITVIKDGFHGDTSRMFMVGTPSIQAKRLVDVTYEAMWKGIRSVRPGAHLGDIGSVIQRHAESNGFTIVREFCGHGIGRRFHEEPQVLHYGRPGTGLKLLAGMVFTIEPMVNAGRPGIRSLADGWTIVTADHSLSAQWEHTVLVTPDGHEILTLPPGAPPPAA